MLAFLVCRIHSVLRFFTGPAKRCFPTGRTRRRHQNLSNHGARTCARAGATTRGARERARRARAARGARVRVARARASSEVAGDVVRHLQHGPLGRQAHPIGSGLAKPHSGKV